MGTLGPLYNGAIGMTYEQGGSSRAGRAITTALGDTLTLAYRILNHHESGLSTVEESARRHEELIGQFADYYSKNVSDPFGGDACRLCVPRRSRRVQNGRAAPGFGCQRHRVRHGPCGVVHSGLRLRIGPHLQRGRCGQGTCSSMPTSPMAASFRC